MAGEGHDNRVDDEPPLPNIDTDNCSFGNSCDRLFNGDDSQETDWLAESMYNDTSTENADARFSPWECDSGTRKCVALCQVSSGACRGATGKAELTWCEVRGGELG